MGETRGYFVVGWGPGAISAEAEAVCLRRSRCMQGRAFQVFFLLLRTVAETSSAQNQLR